MSAPSDPHAEALAIVEDHHGINHYLDVTAMEALFRWLGWQMLTPDALSFLAGYYEAEDRRRERINAENRAIRERNEVEAALTRRAQERGREIAAEHPLSPEPSQVAA